MKQFSLLLALFVLLLLNFGTLNAQLYQGPAIGNLNAGVTQSMDVLSKTLPNDEKPFVRDRPVYIGEPDMINMEYFKPAGSNYVIDQGAASQNSSILSSSVLLKNWDGISMTNSIPPDPSFAAGPTHTIGMVNTSITVWDREGNVVKVVPGASWITPSVTNAGVVTDPKIVYDHFAKRFVMVWLTVNDATHLSYWTVSVSDDSIPLGTWYTWATPSHNNGNNNADNFGDYEALGFDKDCIYITGNQFQFGGGFQYSKLRIIPKAPLLLNTAGPMTWTDLWDIRVPGASQQTFGIRPAIVFGQPNEYYLIYCNRISGNTFYLYKLTNPLTPTPTMTGTTVPVTFYSIAPGVNQLGGSTTLIDGGDSQIRIEPIYRDGKLHVIHSVQNPNNGTYSALHYVKIDVATSIAESDFVYGNVGNWYSYPAVMADKDNNIVVNFSRSGDNEYIGAWYATRLATDPAGFEPSRPLAEGRGNYVVTFSGTRNRWGDYMGIALDPIDNNDIWMFTEYAASTNRWGTYVGKVRMVPYQGIHIEIAKPILDMGHIEINHSSDEIPVILANLGTDDFVISNIPSTFGPFSLVDNLTFPITMSTYDSLTLRFKFSPTATGIFQQTYPFTSNYPGFPGLVLEGRGYRIGTTASNTIYASTGSGQNGDIFTLSTSGTGTSLGSSLYPEVRGISVNPQTRVIFGVWSDANTTEILRVNAEGGDAYDVFSIPVGDMAGVAIDSNGNVFAGAKNGVIYQINLLTKDYSRLCSVKVNLASITIDPATNEMWGTPNVAGSSKDYVFKINTTTGDTMRVGKTLLNLITNAIAFDHTGVLYGVTGAPSAANNLITINVQTGAGTVVGSTGVKHITGLAVSPFGTSGIHDPIGGIPESFSLAQNYPNPFNPATVIEYSLPEASNIKLTVYNLLGQKITELVNDYKEAGNYRINWNASSSSGNKLTSGIYFYEMKAVSNSGAEFTQLKKMLYIK